MKNLSRVVWSEGMYLGPHQFQAQSRYFEDTVRFSVSTLWPFGYGLTGLELDEEALRNGTVSVLHARGIFPDGTAFHMPQCDAAPASRSLTGLFPPASDSVSVFLAIAEFHPQSANLSDAPGTDAQGTEAPGRRSARFYPETRSFSDENTGGDERPISVGRKNLYLLFDMEPRQGHVTLPVARVRRDGSGHFLYDREFIPSCLQMGASQPLMELLQRLLEILEAKSAALSRTAGMGIAPEFATRDVANFWLLHAVNSAIAPLRHLWISKQGHPEELFMELSRLAGALCTFVLKSDPTELPAYDHQNPGICFAQLDRHIRAHLETVVPTNCVKIPLRKEGQFLVGEVTDTRCFGSSLWVVGVRSSMGDAALITRAPELIKVCSSMFVGELVRRAIAGLPLRHLPAPPPAVPVSVESQYFSISKGASKGGGDPNDRARKFWESIVQTKTVGIYVPGDLPDAALELFAVLDS